MRYLELKCDGKIYTSESKINEILTNHKLYWLIDSEVEKAAIEIKKNTLIWHSGSFYSGYWFYGIFKSGDFYGIWQNGIFEGGNFKGKWMCDDYDLLHRE